MKIRKILGRNVRKARRQHRMTQEQLSEKVNITAKHLSMIETGNKFVSEKCLEKIVEVFDVKPSMLLDEREMNFTREIRFVNIIFTDANSEFIDKLIKIMLDKDEADPGGGHPHE